METDEPSTLTKLTRIYMDPFVWFVLLLGLVLMSQVHTFAGFAFVIIGLVGYMIFVGGYL